MNYSGIIEIFKQSATFALGKMLVNQTQDFFETLGEMGIRTWQVFYLTIKALEVETHTGTVFPFCCGFFADYFDYCRYGFSHYFHAGGTRDG